MTSSIFILATLLLGVTIVYATEPAAPPEIQTLFNGVRAQELILTQASNMDRYLIPFGNEGLCSSCGANPICKENCEKRFYRLMHSMTTVHDQYQKLKNLQEQDSNDQELIVLSQILEEMSKQACALLDANLPAGSLECTYSELMKMKAKLELLFVTEQMVETLEPYQPTHKHVPSFIEDISCNMTEEGLQIVRTVHDFTNVQCSQAS